MLLVDLTLKCSQCLICYLPKSSYLFFFFGISRCNFLPEAIAYKGKKLSELTDNEQNQEIKSKKFHKALYGGVSNIGLFFFNMESLA